jgi:hypothetical protein
MRGATRGPTKMRRWVDSLAFIRLFSDLPQNRPASKSRRLETALYAKKRPKLGYELCSCKNFPSTKIFS